LNRKTIIIFAKPAEPGEVKTRLTGLLTDEQAASLYRSFLADLAEMLAAYRDEGDGHIELVLGHTGSADHPSFAPFRDLGFSLQGQSGTDLGARMGGMISDRLDRGADQAVVIGSDSPTLQPRHLDRAFERLARADVVLGPSFDGGYYLVGMGHPHTPIFQEIDWSTPRVLDQTMRRADDAGLVYGLLEFWYDVDTPRDLHRLWYHLQHFRRTRDHPVAPETQERIATQLDDPKRIYDRDDQ
jgi:hypothetical protein